MYNLTVFAVGVLYFIALVLIGLYHLTLKIYKFCESLKETEQQKKYIERSLNTLEGSPLMKKEQNEIMNLRHYMELPHQISFTHRRCKELIEVHERRRKIKVV